jgi:hypothetical protein
MSGIAELFKNILVNYANEYSRNKKTGNPYFKELRNRSTLIFKSIISSDLNVKPIGGQGLIAKSPYTAILANNQKVSRGIYLIFNFDCDTKKVSLKFGDSDDNPPPQDLVTKFGKFASQLLPDFEKKDDGYPIKHYSLNDLNDELLESDLNRVLDVYTKCVSEFSTEIQEYVEQGKSKKPINLRKFWLYAPGRNGEKWHEFRLDGIMAIGWDTIGDIAGLSRKEIKSRLQGSEKSNKSNSILACNNFCNKISIGDVVIAKQGTKGYLGWGVIDSDYLYDSKRNEFNKIRRVNWISTGEWKETGRSINRKALTDITKDIEYVNHLVTLLKINLDNFNAPKIKASTDRTRITKFSLDNPRNVIFWGPPGTGKTYQLFELQKDFQDSTDIDSRDQIIQWIQDLSWWEVIAAAMIEINQPVSVPELFKHDYVQIKARQSSTKTPKNTIWSRLQYHTVLESKTVTCEHREEPYVVDKDANSKWYLTGDWKEQLSDLISGKQEIKSGKQHDKAPRYEIVTFHQSYSYEEFVEGIRPDLSTDGSSSIQYEIRPGVFRRLCQRAIENPQKQYALFIDEINRGNLSKIFGELITLIEKDKRLGMEHEIKVTLPYSGLSFGVPNNIHIIGTMNSVDRSIALVDMGLRRRFEFISVMPDAGHVPKDVEGINIQSIFKKLNQKIAVIHGSEYQLGHSYFMGNKTRNLKALRNTWFSNVLPLLQEYFFDDWEKLKTLVGGFVTETDVPDLEGLSKKSYGSFVSTTITEDEFIRYLKALE